MSESSSKLGAFIYLASQSPRRAQLLEQLGVSFRWLLADASEDVESLEAQQRGESAEAYVRRVSLAKLDAARARGRARGCDEAPVLCADTTVALGTRIFGKPGDEAEALEMLQALSGRTHRVCTAVAVARGLSPRKMQRVVVQTSRVTVAPLSRLDINRYIASREPFGKAGAYAIQGRFAAHVRHVAGSHSGIMGLPLFETATLLKALAP